MNKISVIVFDLGNVLLPFEYDRIKNKFNSISKNLGEQFFEKYDTDPNFHRSHERGDITREEFINTCLGWLNNKVTETEFCKIYSDIFTVNQNVADLLPKLKKNYQLVLLSNTNSIHKEYAWGSCEFIKYFDKLILSNEVGAYKPEPKIYKAVEGYTQKPASEHIFIDDIKEYAEGAKSMGWNGIQFLGYKNLVDELKKRDIVF